MNTYKVHSNLWVYFGFQELVIESKLKANSQIDELSKNETEKVIKSSQNRLIAKSGCKSVTGLSKLVKIKLDTLNLSI